MVKDFVTDTTTWYLKEETALGNIRITRVITVVTTF